MDAIGAYVLPGLLILILGLLAFVTIYWVNDGSDADEVDDFVRGQYRASLRASVMRWVRRWLWPFR
jgi:hypothetical protein